MKRQSSLFLWGLLVEIYSDVSHLMFHGFHFIASKYLLNTENLFCFRNFLTKRNQFPKVVNVKEERTVAW